VSMLIREFLCSSYKQIYLRRSLVVSRHTPIVIWFPVSLGMEAFRLVSAARNLPHQFLAAGREMQTNHYP